MNHHLALLSAILANPDDDLPRLVFADWLEENGNTDADAARVEFIRLGCKSKAKSRITPAETKWLDANWQRLLGNTVAARPNGAGLPKMVREGRFVRLTFRWEEPPLVRVGEVVFEFVRGFARRVEYKQGHSYQRFWRATAADEPLAYHRPEERPPAESGSSIFGWEARLLPTTWGEAVFTRATGGRSEPDGRQKFYGQLSSDTADDTHLHPLAQSDEHGIFHGNHRLRAAVATAMTAIAREFVGLTSPSPAG